MNVTYKELSSLVNRKIGYGIVQPGKNVTGGVHIIKVFNIIQGLKSINDLDTTAFEISEKYSRTKLNGGELIISVVGTVGKTAIVSKKFAGCNLVRATALIDIPDENITLWVKYYLDSPKGQLYINNNLNTTVQPTLNIKSLEEMPIPFYEMDYIKKSISILSIIDNKIALNTSINENLEQQAQAIYQTYFSPKSDTYGEIVTLDKFCSIFTGKKNANASVKGGKYKFFTCAPDALQINSYIYDGNAIIVSGNGAYTGRTRFYSGKFDLYQRTYACCLLESTNPDYIFPLYWFVKLELSKKIMGGTRGSAIPYIVMNDLAKFEFIYNSDMFTTYSPVFKKLTETIQHNELENERLSALRDTLLPKLMNGEIDVSNVKI